MSDVQKVAIIDMDVREHIDDQLPVGQCMGQAYFAVPVSKLPELADRNIIVRESEGYWAPIRLYLKRSMGISYDAGHYYCPDIPDFHVVEDPFDE